MENLPTLRGEPPIRTWAEVVSCRAERRLFEVRLPNGKVSHGHVPQALESQLLPIELGAEVIVEFTPYDLDRGRIVHNRSISRVPNR